MSFERIAENRIRAAMEQGEFDHLPEGKRVDLDEYFAMPEEVRMAHSILKNANCLPEDVVVLNTIERLQQRLQAACDPRDRSEIARQLREQQLRLDLLRDRRRSRK